MYSAMLTTLEELTVRNKLVLLFIWHANEDRIFTTVKLLSFELEVSGLPYSA
jgi:hypothetical protein